MLTRLILLFLVATPLVDGQVARHRRGRAQARFPAARLKSRKTSDYLGLIKNLRGKGANVESTKEKVSQPFFSVPGRIIRVNNGFLQVFEYPHAAAADSEAKRVNPDGMSIGTSKPSWMATPHFFRSGKLIVLFLGDDQSLLKILQTTIGFQFAGG